MYDAHTLSVLRAAVERQPGLIRGIDQLEVEGRVFYCATGSLPYKLRDCAGTRAGLHRPTLLWAQAVNDRFSARETTPCGRRGWSFGVEDMVERRVHVLKAIDDQLAVCREHAAPPTATVGRATDPATAAPPPAKMRTEAAP
jgi:hypothetical protein